MRSKHLPEAPWLFVHGGAGVGKTHLMNCVDDILHLRARRITSVLEKQNTGMVACIYTGFAAHHLRGGNTVHSLFGMAPTQEGKHDKMNNEKMETIAIQLRNCVFILIDEVSMIPAKLFGVQGMCVCASAVFSRVSRIYNLSIYLMKYSPIANNAD